MDGDKLKLHALLLEKAIQDNILKSGDVAFLAQYKPLVKAIEDAKLFKITSPRNLGGLYIFVFESSIQDFKEISERLAEFSLILRGLELPSEGDN